MSRGGWGPDPDPVSVIMCCLDKRSECSSGEGVEGASAGGLKMGLS